MTKITMNYHLLYNKFWFYNYENIQLVFEYFSININFANYDRNLFQILSFHDHLTESYNPKIFVSWAWMTSHFDMNTSTFPLGKRYVHKQENNIEFLFKNLNFYHYNWYCHWYIRKPKINVNFFISSCRRSRISAFFQFLDLALS